MTDTTSRFTQIKSRYHQADWMDFKTLAELNAANPGVIRDDIGWLIARVKELENSERGSKVPDDDERLEKVWKDYIQEHYFDYKYKQWVVPLETIVKMAEKIEELEVEKKGLIKKVAELMGDVLLSKVKAFECDETVPLQVDIDADIDSDFHSPDAPSYSPPDIPSSRDRHYSKEQLKRDQMAATAGEKPLDPPPSLTATKIHNQSYSPDPPYPPSPPHIDPDAPFLQPYTPTHTIPTDTYSPADSPHPAASSEDLTTVTLWTHDIHTQSKVINDIVKRMQQLEKGVWGRVGDTIYPREEGIGCPEPVGDSLTDDTAAIKSTLDGRDGRNE